MRKPLRIETLNKIKQLNIPISTIIDVGVKKGTKDLINVFNDKPHILIEPVIEFNLFIKENYEKNKIDYHIINVGAYDADGMMNLETRSIESDKNIITHSRLTSQNSDKTRQVTIKKIDTILQENYFEPPYLLKIDVDGVELMVLKGSQDILKHTNVVIIEVTTETFFERSLFLTERGFQLFDIVDPCYYDDYLHSVDLIFLNPKTIIDMGILQNKKFDFDISKWYTYK